MCTRFGRLLACALLITLASACERVRDALPEGLLPPAKSAPASGDVDSADLGAARSSDLTSLGPGADARIYYQYIDDGGSVRFVERLEDVPAAWRDRVGYLELDTPPPLSPGDADRVREKRFASSDLASIRSPSGTGGSDGDARPRVLLYYADWCGYCKRAKRHLDGAGVAYELRDVDDPAIKDELIVKTGQKGIPVIEIGGRLMKGYNKRRLDELLATL